MTARIALGCAVLVAVFAVQWVTAFWRDVRRAGGLRALHAELTGTTPPAVPAPEPPPMPWWQDPHAGLDEKRPPKLWEPVTPRAVTGVPPWDPAAASQGTGYTKFHADDLRRLLDRTAAMNEPAALQAHANGTAPGGAESGD